MKIKNISLERKKYLSKIKKQKILVFITQMLILIGFLAIWEILANANIIGCFFANVSISSICLSGFVAFFSHLNT